VRSRQQYQRAYQAGEQGEHLNGGHPFSTKSLCSEYECWQTARRDHGQESRRRYGDGESSKCLWPKRTGCDSAVRDLTAGNEGLADEHAPGADRYLARPVARCVALLSGNHPILRTDPRSGRRCAESDTAKAPNPTFPLLTRDGITTNSCSHQVWGLRGTDSLRDICLPLFSQSVCSREV
jgi:hypothetical protein